MLLRACVVGESFGDVVKLWKVLPTVWCVW